MLKVTLGGNKPPVILHGYRSDHPLVLRGYPWALFEDFEDFVHFFKKRKQLRTKYHIDMVRNVPRNSK